MFETYNQSLLLSSLLMDLFCLFVRFMHRGHGWIFLIIVNEEEEYMNDLHGSIEGDPLYTLQPSTRKPQHTCKLFNHVSV